MYNILKIKTKSIFKAFTNNSTMVLKIMILGFILINAMIIIKYKPVYEVKVANETIGYVKNKKEFAKLIEDNILNIQEDNLDSILLKDEPEYERKLVLRNKKLNEEEIIEKLENSAITTYKFYSVSLKGKTQAYVDTVEEAEKVVKKIKKEYKGNGLKLDLAIEEVYTEDVKKVKTKSVKIAQKEVETTVESLLKKEEAKKALAVINGINVSVLPVYGRVTSRFGVSSSIRHGSHTGLDIACSKGTAIKVVAKGKVSFAAYNGSYGNLIKVDHGNGVTTWYAHCSKIYARVGQNVSAGDIIGTVGSTGNSTGSHLHLEIRINDTPINPQRYLY